MGDGGEKEWRVEDCSCGLARHSMLLLQMPEHFLLMVSLGGAEGSRGGRGGGVEEEFKCRRGRMEEVEI